MKALEDWLSETIRIELNKVLISKSGEVNNVQTPEAVYEDDGSNLRVRCPVRGTVQIIKVGLKYSPIRPPLTTGGCSGREMRSLRMPPYLIQPHVSGLRLHHQQLANSTPRTARESLSIPLVPLSVS